ncbi:hypothetical protein [Methylorubrum extorquens]
MKASIKEIQSALVPELSRWERKNIRYLFPVMAEQRTRVMKAIGWRHDKHERMEACGTMDDKGHNMRLCGVPLCPRCFMVKRGRETGKAIKRYFAGAANDDMAFLTLLVPPTCDLGTVDPCMDETETSVRNMIRYKRKSDERWNSVHYTGWWEMDRHDWQDAEIKLGRNKKLALASDWPQFGYRDDQTVWQPHLHALVHLGDVTRDEFANALRAKGHNRPYQVNVTEFHQHKHVAENIKTLVRYSMKFRIETDYKMSTAKLAWNGTAMSLQRNWWKDEDITAYVDWLLSKRGGFERLKTRMGPKRS